MGVLIPVIAVGGFFAWMIARVVSNAYTARLQAQETRGPTGADEDVLAALEGMRREVAELAERMDFLERLLAKDRDTARLAPGVHMDRAGGGSR